MNLRQAAATGKPFKRPHWNAYYKAYGKNISKYYPERDKYSDDLYDILSVGLDDLEANDFKVKEDLTILTKSRFEVLFDKAIEEADVIIVDDSHTGYARINAEARLLDAIRKQLDIE